MMIDDIQPRTTIEWLWTFDMIELSWEVLRYRRLMVGSAHARAHFFAVSPISASKANQ